MFEKLFLSRTRPIQKLNIVNNCSTVHAHLYGHFRLFLYEVSHLVAKRFCITIFFYFFVVEGKKIESGGPLRFNENGIVTVYTASVIFQFAKHIKLSLPLFDSFRFHSFQCHINIEFHNKT